jgi:hypothetical protein
MTLFADLTLQPKNSRISVDRPDSDTVTLAFPRYFKWYWPAILCAVGIGLLAWEWRSVIQLLHLDAKVFQTKEPTRAIISALGCLAFGVVFLVGRFRVTVTGERIGRALRVVGVRVVESRAEWATVADVACSASSASPVIWISPTEGGRFVIEGFASVEERDWVARELTAAWQNARPAKTD